MGHWDGEKVVYSKPSRYNTNWIEIDCGCCGGIEWSYGDECDYCYGNGYFFVHIVSGTGAQYPGGPFNGVRFSEKEVRELLESIDS